MNAWSSARRGVVRHPVLAFMLISVGIGFATAAIPPIVDAEILPFGLPLHGVFMSLGAGLAAFLVTSALSGRAGVADLTRRSVRWRVPVRWYVIALLSVPVGATVISLVIYGSQALATPSGGWPRALAEVAAVFVLQLVLFQLAEEIGFTGFLQHHWQDRYDPMKLTLYVALLWAVWHIPDHFAEEGWGVEALISAFRYRVRLIVLRPRLVCVVLQPDGVQRAAGGDLPCQLRCRNQPALLRRGARVEHGKIPDLQRRRRCFRDGGDHRNQRPARPSQGGR
jgi:membrane protease YdiL (CAAX protease family)